MDILSWGIKNQNRFIGKLILGIIYFFMRLLTPNSILINANQCAAVAAELYRKGSPKYILVMGGFQNPCICLETLPANQKFLIGGSEKEQPILKKQLSGLEATFLSPSNNTLEEIRKGIALIENKDNSLGLLVHEILCVRATSTFVKEVYKTSESLRIVPYPCLDFGREFISSTIKDLAVLIEAWKLWKYQKKGDVATLAELMKYVRGTQTAG